MKIGITTGDLDGVGLEIAIKSLQKIKIPKSCEIVLYCGKSFGKVTNLKLKNINVVASPEPPARWVEICAAECLSGKMTAMVTGPLSKPEIKKTGMKDLGHTEILGRLANTKDLFMSFWGKHFNVVLITGHLPLSKAHLDYTPAKIQMVIGLVKKEMAHLDPKRAHRPLALLGINPHAGDQGLIGNQEQINHPMLQLQGVDGPLPGDSAFMPENFKKYGAFLAAYHDQGLIPFKLAHGFDSGVHVTLGLPFLRTSVDHGPAKDLFGKNKASIGSMKAAIEMALQRSK